MLLLFLNISLYWSEMITIGILLFKLLVASRFCIKVFKSLFSFQMKNIRLFFSKFPLSNKLSLNSDIWYLILYLILHYVQICMHWMFYMYWKLQTKKLIVQNVFITILKYLILYIYSSNIKSFLSLIFNFCANKKV